MAPRIRDCDYIRGYLFPKHLEIWHMINSGLQASSPVLQWASVQVWESIFCIRRELPGNPFERHWCHQAMHCYGRGMQENSWFDRWPVFFNSCDIHCWGLCVWVCYQDGASGQSRGVMAVICSFSYVAFVIFFNWDTSSCRKNFGLGSFGKE